MRSAALRGPGDASVTTRGPDAPVDACTSFGPWQSPVALSNDGQTLVFATGRTGSGDIYQVPWAGGTPQPLALDSAQVRRARRTVRVESRWRARRLRHDLYESTRACM